MSYPLRPMRPPPSQTPVPLLVISGSLGAGKSTVLSEASDLLAEAGVPHAAIDLDALAVMHPRTDPHGESLAFANLAAVWPNYADAGATRLLIARVVENREDLDRYRAAVPGAEPVVCRLTAPLATMRERLRLREPGMFLQSALARAEELDAILRRASVEDFAVDNGPGRRITDVAREVLTRAGWLPRS